MENVKHPEITIPLSSIDGNIFFILGTCKNEMRRKGLSTEEINKFISEVTSCNSYDEALQVVMSWFDVE